MIIGFTGTRYGMRPEQHTSVKELIRLNNYFDHIMFHHGDCIGADAQAHEIATRLNILTVIHPPTDPKLRAYCDGWLVHPPKPYDQRNLDIVAASDLVIAAPNTETEQPRGGTWQVVRFARENKKTCKIVLPSGIVVDA